MAWQSLPRCRCRQWEKVQDLQTSVFGGPSFQPLTRHAVAVSYFIINFYIILISQAEIQMSEKSNFIGLSCTSCSVYRVHKSSHVHVLFMFCFIKLVVQTISVLTSSPPVCLHEPQLVQFECFQAKIMFTLPVEGT